MFAQNTNKHMAMIIHNWLWKETLKLLRPDPVFRKLLATDRIMRQPFFGPYTPKHNDKIKIGRNADG